MKRVAVLPFRMGSSVSERIPKKEFEFYKWLINILFGQDCELNNKSLDIRTIPFSSENIEQDNTAFDIYFGREYEKYHDNEIFIIYINNPFKGIIRATFYIHIAQAINELFKQNINLDQKFIILLPELPLVDDIVYKSLEKYVKDDKVLIIDEFGYILTSENKKFNVPKDEFRKLILNFSELDLFFLERKMIRRLGHFHRVRKDGKEYCNRYFYDGRLCDKELEKLILNYLKNQSIDSTTVKYLLYHCPMSDWLGRTLASVCIKTNLYPINLYEYIDDPGAFVKGNPFPKKGSKCILIVDIIDTSRTFFRLYKKLQEQSVEIIDLLAILVTGPTDNGTLSRTLIINNELNNEKSIKVNYFLEIEQERSDKGKCELCKLDVPYSNKDDPKNDLILFDKKDDYMMIPSYDHWGISFKHNLLVEKKQPKYRKSIPLMINYKEVLDENGPWIAYKVLNRLELEGSLSGTIIVTPAGGGSESFTESVNIILEKQIIKIPHNVIDSCSNEKFQIKKGIAEWKNENPEWLKSLMNSGPLRVIIMEEFNITGRTFFALKRLVEELSHKVVCFFPLNNLNPNIKLETEIPIFTLYEWKSFNSPSRF